MEGRTLDDGKEGNGKSRKKQYPAIGKGSADNHIWAGYKMHKLAVEKGSIRLQYAIVSHPIIGAAQ